MANLDIFNDDTFFLSNPNQALEDTILQEEEELNEKTQTALEDESNKQTQVQTQTVSEEVEEDQEEIDDVFFDLTKSIFEQNKWEADDKVLDAFADAGGGLDGFMSVFNHIIETNSVPEYASEISEKFDHYLKAGGDPKTFMESYFPSDTVELDNLDLTVTNTQAWVMYQYYKATTKFSDEDINEAISDLHSLGTLEGKATRAIVLLKQQEEINKQKADEYLIAERQAAFEEAKKQRHAIEQYVGNGSEEELAVPMTKTEKQGFLNFLLTESTDTGETEWNKVLRSQPEDVIKLAALYYKGATKNKLQKIVKTKVVNDLESTLAKKLKERGSTVATKSNSKSKVDLSFFDR